MRVSKVFVVTFAGAVLIACQSGAAPPQVDPQAPPPPEAPAAGAAPAAMPAPEPSDAELGRGLADLGRGRIVGGTPARAGTAPWQIEIYSTAPYTDDDFKADRALKDNDPNKFFYDQLPAWERVHRCGGALISREWIVTAAHCVSTRPGAFLGVWRVRLGTQDLRVGGTTYAIDRAAVHGGYDRRLHINDIALIHIVADAQTGPVPAAATRSIAVLGDDPADRALVDHDPIIATGWGRTKVKRDNDGARAIDGTVNHASAALMQVSLVVVSPEKCAAIPEYVGKIGGGVLCAGSPTGARGPARDTCNGDSGGPLTRAKGSTRILVGVVSWGTGCGLPGVPGIYTRVSEYRGWLKAAMAVRAGTVTPVPAP